VIEVAPLKFGAVFKQAFSQVEVFKQFVKIHDHTRPYPRSLATLSTITRNPIYDHSQPYPRSAVNKIFGYAVAN